MRDFSPVLQALLESKNLDLVALVELQLKASTLRFALDTHPRLWNGQTFERQGGGFSETEESAERGIPSLQLTLQNRDGILGPKLHPAAGGEDPRGRRAVIRVAGRELLDGEDPEALVIGWTFFINDVHFQGREAVILEIGVFPAEVIRVPNRNLQGLRCVWLDYKGVHCGSASSLETCNRTLDDCKVRFPGEPLRYGAFPAQADARVLRL